MKPISCLFFLVLILALWPRRIVTTDDVGDSGHLIDRACDAAPYKDLCKASIKDDCESPNANNFQDVAKIAVKVAYLNASDSQEYMKELLGNATDAFMHQSIMDCSSTYDDAIGNLEDSLAAFDSEGWYKDVQTWVAAAIVDPQTCEDYFKDIPGHTSPLTSRNTVLIQLCDNALAVSKLAAAGK